MMCKQNFVNQYLNIVPNFYSVAWHYCSIRHLEE